MGKLVDAREQLKLDLALEAIEGSIYRTKRERRCRWR